ncbi:ABC transporter ATP-binding protein [Natronococcus sp. A-GB7]|uniref:ABC transporter ATP-binding protein n=1 Tax=Natronococcus sp. A-GB7 TaxID=3037649 RepID=UPI00241E82F0|nr:ABC transporter ATP-binding protein [Natronococcus sp. A-GB7]MDG5817957.1 ABC transporter ATP-binding protein [Natronococcus sp. A-GB7]
MSVLETNDLTKRYGGRPVVDALDLTVERGEVFGLAGSTGAGKSTLLDLLAGSVRPSRGSATVLGLDPWHDRDRPHERVGYLRETIDLDGTQSGWEHLRRGTDRTTDDAAVTATFDRVGIAPDVAARPVRTYSAGTARRLSLAMFLVGDPDLLLLDAPTAGLDGSDKLPLEAIVEDAADEGSTVVLEVAHAGVAIHDFTVAAPDDSNRQRPTDSRTTDGER